MPTNCTHDRILFVGTNEDIEYLPYLKPLLGHMSAASHCSPVSTWAEISLKAKAKNATAIISTSVELLMRLVPSNKKPSINNYAGSLFVRDGLEVLFIDPLKHMGKQHYVPYAKFLADRFISKFRKSADWYTVPEVKWEVLTPDRYKYAITLATNCIAIAIDIETLKTPIPNIRCMAYTFVMSTSEFITLVLPLTNESELAMMRNLNASANPKIFQNGKYDNFYFLAYNAPCTNWLFDTQHYFHAAYAELPKDLGFLQSFYVRNSQYWKDLADTTDLQQYYQYNARDAHGTAATWMVQLLSSRAYEVTNYVKEFPIVFPCLVTELTGVKRDMVALGVARAEAIANRNRDQQFLNHVLGGNFNANSPIQVRALLKILGIENADSGDEKALKKYGYMHPLNNLLLEKVLDIRGNRKLISTYLPDGTDKDSKGKVTGAKEFRGRLLYSINPHGTDTLRSSSRESAFWCGIQIQNVPRTKDVKQTIVSDDGFLFGECDYSKAESFGTAYTSGDEHLLAAVNSPQDFHSANASKFFGVPYESIYNDALKKTLNKPIRQVSKNTNHGANYLMGPDVMVDTMGLKAVFEARKLLGLPKHYTPRQVCEYLLEQFHRTYPGLRKTFYPGVAGEVKTTGKLTSALGWTRVTFKDPSNVKRDLNSCVAHVPQNLNAEILNDAFHRVMYEVWMPNYHNFKLIAVIHDSILFQFRIGFEHLAQSVREIMEQSSTRDIKGYDGQTRTMRVPAELKPFGRYWSDLID